MEDILVTHERRTIVEAFHTSYHPIPDGVKFIVPISKMPLRNLKLAMSRRICQLGYAGRVKAVIRSRKLILIRISRM